MQWRFQSVHSFTKLRDRKAAKLTQILCTYLEDKWRTSRNLNTICFLAAIIINCWAKSTWTLQWSSIFRYDHVILEPEIIKSSNPVFSGYLICLSHNCFTPIWQSVHPSTLVSIPRGSASWCLFHWVLAMEQKHFLPHFYYL